MIRVFAYPTHNGVRLPLWEAQSLAHTPPGCTPGGALDGWSEEPADGRDDLEMLSLALRWASEGQAVRIEFN